jgi:AraC-like DNA-binding protein
MGVFLLLLTFYFTFNLLYRLRVFEVITYVYYWILPIILSFIPVFYLYILSITTPEFRLHRKHLLHFIPALFILVLNSPYLFVSQADKLLYITQRYSLPGSDSPLKYLLIVYVIGIYGICNIQLFYYLIQTVRLYRIHKQYIVNHYSYTENIDLNWILALIIAFVSFFILNNVLYIVGFKQHILSQVFYTVSMLGITLFAGIQGMRQKDLEREFIPVKLKASNAKTKIPAGVNEELTDTAELKQIHITEEIREPSGESQPEQYFLSKRNEPTGEKYSGSALSDVQKQLIIQKLEMLMTDEKIFIMDSLSVEHVAGRLQTNTKYISQVINEYHKKNFYNYINTYRVEEAKRLLLETGNEKYSILGIAQMVGFVSKSTFNSAFKRVTGITPSEFKKVGVERT